MTRKVLVWLVAPIVAGWGVLWTGVTLTGYTAAFVAEYRMFGFPPNVVSFLEDIIVWVPLSMLTGAGIGFAVPHKSVCVALASSVAAIIFIITLGVSAGLTFAEAAHTTIGLFREPVLCVLITLPLGAYLYTRVRPNPPLNRTGADDAHAAQAPR